MSALTRITERVYWMPPVPPDRPSLCAVVGDRRTLMLDAGSSGSHARAFLNALLRMSGTHPSAVVYTHSHWDHVLGGAEVCGVPSLRNRRPTDYTSSQRGIGATKASIGA